MSLKDYCPFQTIHREKISNKIKKRNRKKKLQGQEPIQNISSSSDIQNEVNLVNGGASIAEITHNHKTIQLKPMPADQTQGTVSSEIKIPYNKRVEQDLRHELSIDVFNIQIPEFSLEVIIMESNKITTQNIADLFIIAMKVRQKEILSRTLVYNEIKSLLPDIIDVNLRQRTFKTKKIYTLLIGIEIEKIQVITCNASAISSLTDNQIQDIINYFPKNSNVDDSSIKYQEMISVINCNTHMTEQSNLNDSEIVINKETKKTLPEIEIVNENSKFSKIVNVFDDFSDFNFDNKNKFFGKKDKSLSKTKVNIPSNPTHSLAYFCNKIVEQYSDLC
ncbi:hypothetical protein Glove_1g1 [Diversispora epigaea]|uniref:Uncharacterized protein n=1 Tax=Diversispora epigaea TaxID=1348612 RepID=A0A397JRH9_9GLOM|nr:hypothetical protein Glove_1g1 [Diversispora epigaea]